jgi:hypothetical protein
LCVFRAAFTWTPTGILPDLPEFEGRARIGWSAA